MPSQSAVTQEDRDLLDIITGNTMKFRPRAETARLEAIARHRIAAEQRGMEKAADKVERLRAENASLRAEIERLNSQTVAVPRLDR